MKPLLDLRIRTFYHQTVSTTTSILATVAWLSSSLEPARAQSWQQTTAPVANWVSVASSADGMRLAALTSDGQAVLISTNGGTNWFTGSPTNGSALGSSITCSADGKILAAGGFRDPTGDSAGNIIVSTNFGANWFTATAASKTWTGLASSADGTMMVGVTEYRRSFGGGIYTSTDLGRTWAFTSAASLNVAYNGAGSTADGTQLMSVGDFIDNSVNDGGTWAQTSAPGSGWASIAGSADGTHWAAASGNNGSGGGPIYLSSNHGSNWVQSTAPITNWVSIASSADGTRLVAAAAGTGIVPVGAIYVSTNSGANWTTPVIPVGNWSCVASSADGTKLVAAIRGGHIYTSQISIPPRLNLVATNGQSVVSWIVPSANFVLQQRTDLISSDWTDVAPSPILNLSNLREEFSAPQTAGPVFYRLVSR